MLSPEMRRFITATAGKPEPGESNPNVLALKSSKLILASYRGPSITDDEFQSCMAHLVRAARMFDPSKAKWSTYAMNVCQRYFMSEWSKSRSQKHDDFRVIKNGTARDGHHVTDNLVDRRAKNPLDAAELSELREKITGVVESLPYRLRDVIILRFGLRGNRPHTLVETAEIIGGIGKERVRQIEEEALESLAKVLG